jgi:hypothetical protein
VPWLFEGLPFESLVRDDLTWIVSVQEGGTYHGTLGIVAGVLR